MLHFTAADRLRASNASGHFLALPESPPQPPSSPCSSRREIMLDSFFELEPKFIIAMRAVEELSKFQPPLHLELKTSIVAWALGLVLGGSPGPEDPAQQALQQQGEVGLQRMLLALLMEDPSAGHWLALLDTIVEDPAFGGLVAKLAVSLADPDAGVREKAREVIGQLLQLLLCQQGLKGKKKRTTIKWEEDPQRPWRESYLHLTSVAEHAALEDALSLARPWVREGGLVLLYTHLGQAHGLLEEEEVVAATTGRDLESAWLLTINGNGQEHSTTLDWMGAASYCRTGETADPSVAQEDESQSTRDSHQHLRPPAPTPLPY
ncbi:UNVERIFIED_CONTAM: hypothetical protein K2H54_049312 [Gekko kuhli]